MMILTDECDHCGGREERVFRDSWTGKQLCLVCLAPIANDLTSSPGTEGDNLEQLLQDEDAP